MLCVYMRVRELYAFTKNQRWSNIMCMCARVHVCVYTPIHELLLLYYFHCVRNVSHVLCPCSTPSCRSNELFILLNWRRILTFSQNFVEYFVLDKAFRGNLVTVGRPRYLVRDHCDRDDYNTRNIFYFVSK